MLAIVICERSLISNLSRGKSELPNSQDILMTKVELLMLNFIEIDGADIFSLATSSDLSVRATTTN